MFWRDQHPVSEDELSAYADSSLDAVRSSQVRAHAETCSVCADALTELNALRSALGEMPNVPAPRSFVLREADVDAAPVPAAPIGGLLGSLTPMLSGVAAIALVAFVVLAGVDLTSTSSQSSNDSLAAAEAVSSERATGDELAPSADAQIGEDDGSDGDAGPVPGVADAVPEPDVTVEDGDTNEYASPPNDDSANSDAETGAEAATISSGDDDGNGLRIAEIVTAAVAVSAGGAALYMWRRNRRMAV